MRKSIQAVLFASVALLTAQVGHAIDRWGLKEGVVELKSAGPMAFGPDGIVFLGDPVAAAVVAVATEDAAADPVRHLALQAVRRGLPLRAAAEVRHKD